MGMEVFHSSVVREILFFVRKPFTNFFPTVEHRSVVVYEVLTKSKFTGLYSPAQNEVNNNKYKQVLA